MQSFQTLQSQEADESNSFGWLVGYMTATRRDIESVFGKPTYDELSDDAKVTVEWVIRFQDGTIARIYDYKRYEEGTPELDEVYEWHIGASTNMAVPLVGTALLKDVSDFDANNPPTFRSVKFTAVS